MLAGFSCGERHEQADRRDRATLDYEATRSYQIIVQVTDKKGNAYQETITILVNDLNETPNAQQTDITLSSTAVDENSTGGPVIGILGNDDTDAGGGWAYVITSDPDQKL